MSKGTRHLRIHYVVSNESHLWWCQELKRWIAYDLPESEGLGKCNVRHFNTKRAAFRHARGLALMGHKDFTITQLNPHCGWRRKLGCGTWMSKDWVWVE